jgi:hypothetical protein
VSLLYRCTAQVLYRLISGMHSSITTSIIQNYFNETTGGLAGLLVASPPQGARRQTADRFPAHRDEGT